MKTTRRNALVGAGVVTVAAAGGVAARVHGLNTVPPAPPLQDASGHLLWRNWSGVETAYPAERAGPTTEEEVLKVVTQSPVPVRPVGAGHSFTGLVPTAGTLLSLDGLAGVVSHDAAANHATVWGGTRLAELGPALAQLGQSMRSLPDINKQSLAGALATGTHGSGFLAPAIHADVLSLRIATPAQGLVECSPEVRPELFNAARVGLGAFGVVTQVRIKTVPAVRLLKRAVLRPTEEVFSEWPKVQQEHRNAEFFVLPFTGMSAVVTHDETTLPASATVESQDADALLDLKSLRDWAGFSTGFRKMLAKAAMAGLKPEESVAESWKVLSNERDMRFNEMEYHLPRDNQIAALREVVTAIETHRPDVFFPIEVRTIAPDDAWLSPFYQRPSGSLAVHAYYKDDFSFMFELVEPILRRHGGRPHWGKLHSLTARELAPLYPRWAEAMEVRRSVDPQGRLLNPYLRRLLADG